MNDGARNHGETPPAHRLNVPSDELARQAVNALRGYAYQIYQSLLAWIALEPKQELHLEVAEDYAVLAEHACSVVQVKDAPSSSVTLNSSSIRQAIQSLWNLQEENPNLELRFRFLTTAPIGKEQHVAFPNGQPGLLYWRAAAREMGDTGPIQRFLADSDFSDELRRYASGATAEQFRQRILRPMSFDCGTDDIATIRQEIDDRLVHHGQKLGISPREAEKASDSLIATVLATVIQKSGRRLTSAEFLRCFEMNTMVSIPTSLMRNLMGAGALPGISSQVAFGWGPSDWLSDLPLPFRALQRSTITSDLWVRLGQSSALWLHGSSGVGKSTLAQLIAQRSSGRWLRVDLRDLDGQEVSNRLRGLVVDPNFTNAAGVVLEDLGIGLDSSTQQRLAIVQHCMQRVHGCVIVTSTTAPTSLIRDALGGCYAAPIPYLTIDEVKELVIGSGGEGDIWGVSVHVFCSGGHPQLVAARISGLSRRGWPQAELFPVDHGGLAVAEIEEERASVRHRLINELPQEHRDLLYRLTLCAGNFDRGLAIAVAEVPIALSIPGEILDSLAGPWIEIVGPDLFRVSPLVAGSASKLFAPDEQTKIHHAIVNHLLERRPFPASFLSQLLTHALISQHVPGLHWLAGAVICAQEHEQRIAEELFILPFFKLGLGEPFIPANPFVSVVLRLAQFKVAARLDPNHRRLDSIVDRVDDESRGLPGPLGLFLRFFCLVTILGESSVSIRPFRWLPLLLEFDRLVGAPEIAAHINQFQIFASGMGGRTVSQFLFFKRANAVSTIEMLTELLTELDRVDQPSRGMLLSSLKEPEDGAALVVNSAWLAEERKATLSKDRGQQVAAEFLRLSFLVEKWPSIDLAVELVCAQVVMLDEYVQQTADALAAAQVAQDRFPTDLRLPRRRHMIYYRLGDHRAALDAIGNVAEHVAGMADIDAAYLLRRIGVSSAETGDLGGASRAFELGHLRASSASIDSMLPMKVGLLADRARVEFERGNPSVGVSLLAQALRLGDSMPVDRGLTERWCWIALAQTVKWLWCRADGPNWRPEPVQIPYGICSDSRDGCKDWKVTSSLVCWYTLATVEQALDLGQQVLAELRSRTPTTILPGRQWILEQQIVLGAIRRGDLGRFRERVPGYLMLSARWLGHLRTVQYEDKEFTQEEFAAVPASAEGLAEIATSACSAFLASFVANGKLDDARTAAALLVKDLWVPDRVRKLLEVFIARPPRITDWDQSLFSWLAALGDASPLNPRDLFMATLTLWQWLPRTQFRSALEFRLGEFVSARWAHVVDEQPFAMKRPRQTVPAILAAAHDSRFGRARLASILVAAEDAVDATVPPAMRQEIRDLPA